MKRLLPQRNHLFAAFFVLTIALASAFSYLRSTEGMLNPAVILQPYLLSKGFLPYTNIEDPRAPLLPLLLSSLMQLFDGNLLRTARLSHSLAVFVLAVLVLWWVYKAKGKWALLAGGLFFWAWSVNFGYWAIAYYEVILAPLFFFVFSLLISKRVFQRTLKFFILGLTVGTGILIKQHAVILGVFCLVWIFSGRRRSNPSRSKALHICLSLSLGVFIPLVLYFAYYTLKGGEIGELFYWTITFPLTGDYIRLGSKAPTGVELSVLLPPLLLVAPFLANTYLDSEVHQPNKSIRSWLLLFLAGTLIFLFPRYSGRHLPTAFPFLTAISGIATADLLAIPADSRQKYLRQGLYVALTAWWLLAGLLTNLPKFSISSFNFTEFNNLIPLANQLTDRIDPTGGLVLLPTDESNSNLYVLLQRVPPDYYLDFYPWFVNPKTSSLWIEALEQSKPQTVIYFEDYLDERTQIQPIQSYISGHYQKVDQLIWEDRIIEILNRRAGD